MISELKASVARRTTDGPFLFFMPHLSVTAGLLRGCALARMTYSITLSARSRSVCGILTPRALAVFKLMTSSNFVGCWIGRSAGFAPLRILSTYTAAWREESVRLDA